MSTVNVCRVITRLPRVGGIEERLAAIAPRLNEGGFRVRVVVIHERGGLSDEIEASGVPVDFVRLKSRLSPSGLRALAAYFREHEVDIVHAHMYRSYIPSSIAAGMARTPVMLGQVHNIDTWESPRQLWLDRALWRWRTGTIVVSERVKENVIDALGCPAECVHVLYNGIDTAKFRDAAVVPELRRELGIADGETVAVVVARLHAKKNHALLLRALSEAGDDAGNLRVVVVGDGAEESNLKRMAQDLGLARRVIFVGPRSDVERFFKMADFSALPSLKEGFSNAVIESLAAGCPVIATDVGGNREAILDGRTGLLVPSGESGPLSDAIVQFAGDADLRRRMSEACALRAEDFSLDAMVHTTRELYTRLLSSA